jgi:hypothetical protein
MTRVIRTNEPHIRDHPIDTHRPHHQYTTNLEKRDPLPILHPLSSRSCAPSPIRHEVADEAIRSALPSPHWDTCWSAPTLTLLPPMHMSPQQPLPWFTTGYWCPLTPAAKPPPKGFVTDTLVSGFRRTRRPLGVHTELGYHLDNPLGREVHLLCR